MGKTYVKEPPHLPDEAEDREMMLRALELARQAYALDEVPVGAVITCDGRIIAEAYNRRETGKCALLHAETEAIRIACAALGGWRLHRCTLYVTLEPCSMCAGAIVNARIPRVVYGCEDRRAGAFGGVLDLNDFPLNHKPELVRGVCEAECRTILQAFFDDLRRRQHGE